MSENQRWENKRVDLRVMALQMIRKVAKSNPTGIANRLKEPTLLREIRCASGRTNTNVGECDLPFVVGWKVALE